MIKILIADDHPIIRTGLQYIIEEQNDMKVVAKVNNGDEAIHQVGKSQPDVVLMNLGVPQVNGINATREIVSQNNDIKVIVLTPCEEESYMLKALQVGAQGYLLKSQDDNDLIEAIRTVYSGNVYLESKAIKTLLDNYIALFDKEKPERKITKREKEVLAYIAQGYTNREVSEKLSLSIKTIESHRSNMMQKLNLKNRRELISYAAEQGYV